jgi:sporulation protein YlmC with PRC-barrel domain
MNVTATVAILIALLSLSVTTTTPTQSTESRTENVTARSELPPTRGVQVERTNGHIAGNLTTVDGKELGILRDFVVDLAAGRIVDIITTLPPHATADGRLVAIPWEVVQWKATPGTFVFVGDEADLQQAPHVSQKVWRHQPVTQWTPAAHRYWQNKRGKLSSSHAQGSPSVLYKAGDLVGITVHSEDGTDLGTIAEVGLRPEDGVIVYALISCTDPLGRGSPRLFQLPWKVLYLDLSQHTAIATIAARTAI